MGCIEGPYGFECKKVNIGEKIESFWEWIYLLKILPALHTPAIILSVKMENTALKVKDSRNVFLHQLVSMVEASILIPKSCSDPIPPRGPSCYTQSDCPPGLTCINSGNGMECAPIHIGISIILDRSTNRLQTQWRLRSHATIWDVSMENIVWMRIWAQYARKLQLVREGISNLLIEVFIQIQSSPQFLVALVVVVEGRSVWLTHTMDQFARSMMVNLPFFALRINLISGCGPNEVMKKCSNACFEKNCGEEQFVSELLIC